MMEFKYGVLLACISCALSFFSEPCHGQYKLDILDHGRYSMKGIHLSDRELSNVYREEETSLIWRSARTDRKLATSFGIAGLLMPIGYFGVRSGDGGNSRQGSNNASSSAQSRNDRATIVLVSSIALVGMGILLHRSYRKKGLVAAELYNRNFEEKDSSFRPNVQIRAAGSGVAFQLQF